MKSQIYCLLGLFMLQAVEGIMFAPNYGFTWEVKGKEVVMTIECPITNYCAIGVGTGMANSDTIVCSYAGATPVCEDGSIGSILMPPKPDTTQHAKILASEMTAGGKNWKIQVSRPMVTGDSDDKNLVPGGQSMIWATGPVTGTEISYHHGNRGVSTIDWGPPATPPPVVTPPPATPPPVTMPPVVPVLPMPSPAVPAQPTTPLKQCTGVVHEWGSCLDNPCCDDGLTCYASSAWFAQCLRGPCPHSHGTCTVLTGVHAPSVAASTCGHPIPGYGNCLHNHCCAAGFKCYQATTWYAQCRPDCPYSAWTCKELHPSQPAAVHHCTPQVSAWGTCRYNYCCPPGFKCYELDMWYAQCRHDCNGLPARWSCKVLNPGDWTPASPSTVNHP